MSTIPSALSFLSFSELSSVICAENTASGHSFESSKLFRILSSASFSTFTEGTEFLIEVVSSIEAINSFIKSLIFSSFSIMKIL